MPRGCFRKQKNDFSPCLKPAFEGPCHLLETLLLDVGTPEVHRQEALGGTLWGVALRGPGRGSVHQVRIIQTQRGGSLMGPDWLPTCFWPRYHPGGKHTVCFFLCKEGFGWIPRLTPIKAY